MLLRTLRVGTHRKFISLTQMGAKAKESPIQFSSSSFFFLVNLLSLDFHCDYLIRNA
jgi:hypothetical protein